MVDLFEDVKESVKVEEPVKEEKISKHWWFGKTCSYCNEKDGLSVWGNGIIRCEKHTVIGVK
jgi:hypothetical protein